MLFIEGGGVPIGQAVQPVAVAVPAPLVTDPKKPGAQTVHAAAVAPPTAAEVTPAGQAVQPAPLMPGLEGAP